MGKQYNKLIKRSRRRKYLARKRFDEWVALDLEYIDNWSLWLDAKILVRTVPVVVLGLGAH